MITKSEFITLYRPRIQMIFNNDDFFQNQSIVIAEKTKTLTEFLNFFVPKYKKNGVFDVRGFEDQILDPNTKTLRLSDVYGEPDKWGLAQTSELPMIGSLNPIPVATDLKSGKTLILDSNHTLANILNQSEQIDRRTQLRVVEITGRDLAAVIQDFHILNR